MKVTVHGVFCNNVLLSACQEDHKEKEDSLSLNICLCSKIWIW